MAEAKNQTGSPAPHRVSTKVRAAFTLALARFADKAKTDSTSVLADFIQASLADDFLATMKMISNYEVKESEKRVEHTGEIKHSQISLSESLALITDAARSGETISDTNTRTH